jgi:hypothetical protein
MTAFMMQFELKQSFCLLTLSNKSFKGLPFKHFIEWIIFLRIVESSALLP